MMRRIMLLLVMLGLAVVVRSQDIPPDFIEAEVDNPAPFVGQPVIFTWRWFLATANAGSTNASTRIQMPDFTGFGQEAIPVSDPQSQLINGRQYQVITQQVVLYPLQSGVLTIAPIRINTPETPFAPASLLETQPISLNVQPLPPTAPLTFKNAVGQFDMSAAISTNSLTAGQPVTLAVRLTGTGNITQVLAPELLLPADWRIYPQPARLEQTTAQVGTRIFEWVLIPLRAGAQIIPSIELSYFNPQLQAYQTVQTAPIALDIVPGNAPQTTPVPTQIASVSQPVLALKPISPTPGTGEARIGLQFWLWWALPPVLAGGVWLMQRRRIVVTDAPRRVSGSRALQQAQARLKAVAGMKPRSASEQVGLAICEYVSAKAGKPVSPDTLAEAVGVLPTDLRRRLIACVEQAQAARYAPVTAGDVNLLLKEVSVTLLQIDKVWRK